MTTAAEGFTLPGAGSYWVEYVEACKFSFWTFLKGFWSEVPGAGQLIPNWHMEEICTAMDAAAKRVWRGEERLHDIVINVPPGTSKSTICSILFPAWTWTFFPEARHICGSHTDNLALDLASKCRAVVRSQRYRALFPSIAIKEDRVGYYTNWHGGSRFTCTIGGKSPMGFHAHFITIDDPIDPKKALSVAELKAANHFVSEVIPSRKVNASVSLTTLIMQRLHSLDPTQTMLERSARGGGAVHHICLPAEVGDNVHPPALKAKYVDGLLEPRRLPKKVLFEFRVQLGAYGYAGQYGQSPVALGGGQFKEHWFNNRVKAAPYDAKRIRYWDRASSTSVGACWTVGTLMAKSPEGNYYVEHVERGQWSPDERNKRMKAVALRDRRRYPLNEPRIFVEAEGGSSGVDAFQGVARALAGFNVRQDRVTGNKEARAEPWACQLESGNVYLVDDGSWDLQAFISEHVAFPLGAALDQVDSADGAFNLLAGAKSLGQMHIIDFGGKQKNTRIVCCGEDDLGSVIITDPAILVWLCDPEPCFREHPPHGLSACRGVVTAAFVDGVPEQFQESWGQVVDPYNKLPEELLPDRQRLKKVWAFLNRHTNAAVWVFCSPGGQRAKSLAYAVADAVFGKRSVVYDPSDPEGGHKASPPNVHAYEVFKSARSLVV